jgi:hypothetical protein
MFPLAGTDYPASTEQLTRAIHDALAQVLTFPKKNEVVHADGGEFPDIQKMRIDLSGAKVNIGNPPPQPKPRGKRHSGVAIGQLEVVGQPIQYEKSKANFHLKASGLSFDFARDAQSHPLLVLTDARDGQVDLKIDNADLQAMLLAAASLAAKEQGVTIQDLKLDLTSTGPRALGVKADVKAKKMMMSGQITIRGKAELDDQLVATLSDLSCEGQGMIGTMAAGFLRDRLKKINGSKFPLMALSLGDVALRDLKLKTNGAIEVHARFGR